MAGRPVSEEHREARKREVDAAIALIKQRNRPVSRKAIAIELGVSVQSLYGTGFLSCYIKELEALGVIDPEQKIPVSVAEAKKLNKTVTRLLTENERLNKKLDAQAQLLLEKDAEISSLAEQLEIERGKNFLRQKREFAQRRI